MLNVKWNEDRKIKDAEVLIDGKKVGTVTAEGLVVVVENERFIITQDMLERLAALVFNVKIASHS